MCDRCAVLERENARLRDLVDAKTRADLLGRLREGLGVTTQGARLLLTLYRAPGQTVPFEALNAALPLRYAKAKDGQRSEHYLRVAVYQIRREVGPGFVKTVRAGGYALTDYGAAQMRAAMAGQFMREAA